MRLDHLPSLCLFGPLNLFSIDFSLFNSLLVVVLRFILLKLDAIADFLLFGNNFVQTLYLLLLLNRSARCAYLFLHFNHLLILNLRSILSILISPILRPLLADLELDF